MLSRQVRAVSEGGSEDGCRAGLAGARARVPGRARPMSGGLGGARLAPGAMMKGAARAWSTVLKRGYLNWFPLPHLVSSNPTYFSSPCCLLIS